jgi:glucose-1-phosphate cytidylyltransferase
MKVVILAGGLGTRLMEETGSRPKPMVEIGGKPILWHIMKMYAKYGYNEFVVCLGYKGNIIKEYFINYFTHNSDLTVELKNNKINIHASSEENFIVTLIDTGLETNTAGRIHKIRNYTDNQTFMLTYGDGVSDVNIEELLKFHKKSNSVVTLTSVQNPGRFGNLDINSNGLVSSFQEKPNGDNMWINGGFFVMEQSVFSYLDFDNVDEIQWEKGPLIQIAKDGKLSAFRHYGFWKPMDALRDKIELENLWNSQKAPWKTW